MKKRDPLESAVDIFDAVDGALRKERSPTPTPARVKIGLGLIRFGIRLFKTII